MDEFEQRTQIALTTLLSISDTLKEREKCFHIKR